MRWTVPAGILVLASVTWAAPAALLKCYQAKDPLQFVGTEDLDNASFGDDSDCTVSSARLQLGIHGGQLFCVPATATNVVVTDRRAKQQITLLPVNGPDPGDRVCYKLTCPITAAPIEHVLVTDQFGSRTLSKSRRVSHLCTPAVRGTAFCGDGTRNGDEECDGADVGPGCGGCQPDCRCRFVDNGDGTVSDRQTGFQWEKKTSDGSVHDAGNTYTWSASGTGPDGTAFTSFLAALNGGATGVGDCSADVSGDAGGFAGHCDWRLPTVVELRTIVDTGASGCGAGGACVDPVFGTTSAGFYWSSTASADASGLAWDVPFSPDDARADPMSDDTFVRAVRGGS